MNRYIFILIFVLATWSAFAEEKYEDVTATVMVSSTFKIVADTTPIDFGHLDPAQTVILYPDRYFNEVRCISNTGRKWVLKAYCQDLRGPKAAISPENLKFRVFWTNGNGVSSHEWAPFADKSVLVYTAAGNDLLGQEVVVQFSYMFKPPPKVPAGNYNAVVTYTIAEII